MPGPPQTCGWKCPNWRVIIRLSPVLIRGVRGLPTNHSFPDSHAVSGPLCLEQDYFQLSAPQAAFHFFPLNNLICDVMRQTGIFLGLACAFRHMCSRAPKKCEFTLYGICLLWWHMITRHNCVMFVKPMDPSLNCEFRAPILIFFYFSFNV